MMTHIEHCVNVPCGHPCVPIPDGERCHDNVPEDACHGHVDWAMNTCVQQLRLPFVCGRSLTR